MKKYVFNLKDLISTVNNHPIWLRYVILRDIISTKYPSLSSGINRELATRLIGTVKYFNDYKFTDGTEYLLTENI
jgi:hypothetical protein